MASDLTWAFPCGVLVPARERQVMFDGQEQQGADTVEPPYGTVSLQAQVPEELVQSMRRFLERHPNWDQYRLVQAALAGFLVQNGMQNRDLTRCYLANLFPSQPDFRGF
jgi:hypothetical protein